MGAPRRLALVAFAFVVASCGGPPDDLSWADVDALIDDAVPGVPSLTTGALAARLDAGSEQVILLDTREDEEFAVSHLRGAIHVGADADAASRLIRASPDAVVVAYCSVGYRSAALVAELIDRGHTNAFNLRGSIFGWASEGRPVFRGAAQVDEVHPYDDSWGRLLPRHLWAYQPQNR